EISTAKVGNGNNMLPIGMAWVQSNGSKSGGTINVTSSFVTDHYVINIGESVSGALAFVTLIAGIARYATVINGSQTEFWVYIWTTAGAKTQQGFHIVVFKP
ncbi:MAG TPA: hypothetical protein VK907_04150, partial [Phnomibacter sp.]|nr:hypothetical protein [Phnomibacter sp.]